jgi:hypothetical protein
MNKRLVLIMVLFIIISFLTILYFSLNKTSSPSNQNGSVVTLSPLNPTELPRSLTESQITYLNIPPSSFPTEISNFLFTHYKTTSDVVGDFSNYFNIHETPREIEGSKGKYLLVNKGSKSVIVSENPLSFSYTDSDYSETNIGSDTSPYKKSSQKILNDFGLLKNTYLYALKGQKYFKPLGSEPNETLLPNNANIIQLDYELVLDGFPLFINDSDSPGAFFRFDGDKNLVQIQGFVLPEIKKDTNLIQIIPYDKAVERLKTNAGSLSSITSKNTSNQEYLTGEIPKTIYVTNVSLGYMYIPNRDNLTPVFVFSGQGTTENTKEVVQTKTIVSAVL